MCTSKKEIELKKSQDTEKWRLPTFIQEAYDNNTRPKMLVKCGKCYECKQERARNWTYKIWLEALDTKNKCFITLTYADDKNGKQQVNKRELQLFIKRLRKKTGAKFKYYAAGEYGEKKGRAHYHIIVIGWQPKDTKIWRGATSKKGHKMYRSKTINKIWGKGITTVQRFSYEEVAYLTLYLNQNNIINWRENKKEIQLRKEELMKLQIEYGIQEVYINKKGKYEYNKIKDIKDLEKEELKEYKKEYEKRVNSIKMKVEPEFNLYSQGMGFKKFIEKKYYKYDMIIDKYTYEIPSEFIRKILDNPEKYDEETYFSIVKIQLERTEKAQEQYEEYKQKTKQELRNEEKIRDIENLDRVRKKGRIDSIF